MPVITQVSLAVLFFFLASAQCLGGGLSMKGEPMNKVAQSTTALNYPSNCSPFLPSTTPPPRTCLPPSLWTGSQEVVCAIRLCSCGPAYRKVGSSCREEDRVVASLQLNMHGQGVPALDALSKKHSQCPSNHQARDRTQVITTTPRMGIRSGIHATAWVRTQLRRVLGR